MSYFMTLCLPDRLNFGDNFIGPERCLRPFPPMKTREDGILGVQPMHNVYGEQVCFVCGNPVVYRKTVVNHTLAVRRE